MALTKKQRAELRMKFGGRCAYCGCELGDKWHADHVEAVRRNISNGYAMDRPENDTVSNMVPACIPCVLADYDNVDDATLQTVIWSGQPPEPDGDVWHLEYVSRGNAIVRAVLKELRKGVQQ